MAISDEDGKEGSPHPCKAVGQLVSHVFDGAVGVGAFAQVIDFSDIPDEVVFGGELAEDHLLLGEVQAPYGPADLDLAPVLFIAKLLGKHPCVFLNAVHQATGRGFL